MAVPYTNIIANALANKPITTPDQPAFGSFPLSACITIFNNITA